ncbi:helix-turn-helix transcriptional regulator [Pseudomaricurvus alkylphenolicus]|uniref:winged helix-turn-helix transcriptional regulator n=1 Tax=Pseudomaricurvus alkylphenolicus TaxID=1306991 RepID=UPI0014226774|nr:helix-turn-helix domain-containing protein [Pseudomaricurvus alkylphenolicus]NIB38726.1 helix-turn-helix transcriptional regulator [Pseudomaricurvus alkylphenolicus]
MSTPAKPLFEACSVHRTMQILSDPWSFLILRELWFGLRRFDDFQTTLNIPRATLSNRLKSLLAAGLLKQEPSREGGRRKEYRFTEMGADLYPTMLTLLRWGDTWTKTDEGAPLILTHRSCRKRCHAEVITSCCGTKVNPKDVEYQDGPGVGLEPLAAWAKTNRSSKPNNFTAPRACSVARSLQAIGDRWSFLLIRELFFGRHRYDLIQKQIGMATNILSNRIKLLIDHDIIEASTYGKGTTWFEYHLTKSGLDLYASFLAMIQWGDRWLAGSKGAPLTLIHKKCGQAFEPKVVCKACKQPIVARDMGYKPGPGWDVVYGEDLLLQNMKPV